MKTGRHRILVVLHMRALGRIGNFIMKMRSISLMMKNNSAIFISPQPPLATFDEHIDELVNAEAEAKRHIVGSAKKRDIKYNVVVKDVHSLQSYVQQLVDKAKDENTAKTIASSSGFDQAKEYVRTKPELQAQHTKISGTVKLIAKSAGKRSFNSWQISDDGEVWVDLPSTSRATTLITGLKPATEKYFRHRPIVKKLNIDWSKPVKIVVT